MLILSNVEFDARSSHYFSFFFSFVSKRSIEFFFSHRWAFHEISLTCWMKFKRTIVEAEKINKNAKTMKKTTIFNKQLRILLKILLINLYAFSNILLFICSIQFSKIEQQFLKILLTRFSSSCVVNSDCK